MQFTDETGVNSSGISLINHGGIKIAITQNHFIVSETGLHQSSNMLGPIGHIEEQFGLGNETLARRIQQNRSDFPANVSTAGLAGHYTRLSSFLKKGGEMYYLGPFTAALDAFQGYKHGLFRTFR